MVASFAPAGVAEMRGFVADATSTVDLHREALAALASGLSSVLRLYAELGFQSFNLPLHSAGPAMLALRVVGRA